MIELSGVKAWYGSTQALFGIDLLVSQGETVALVGTNGAGKSTTLRALLGALRTEGSVTIDGHEVSKLPMHKRVRDHRIAIVHEGRGLLSQLTVLENLLVGSSKEDRARLDGILRLFPVLRDRTSEKVSLLSGGQQQMVALGRALLREPKYLLLDEPALGLAPVVIDEIYGYIRGLSSQGMGVVLVEQSVQRAASVADRLALLQVGKVERVVSTQSLESVNALVADAFDLGEGRQDGPTDG